MAENIVISVFLALALMMLATMIRLLLRTKSKLVISTPMLLSHDFFLTIMLIFSLWSLLLMLMATKSLLIEQRQIIVIISAFLCPFLFWWWKKQSGSKS